MHIKVVYTTGHAVSTFKFFGNFLWATTDDLSINSSLKSDTHYTEILRWTEFVFTKSKAMNITLGVRRRSERPGSFLMNTRNMSHARFLSWQPDILFKHNCVYNCVLTNICRKPKLSPTYLRLSLNNIDLACDISQVLEYVSFASSHWNVRTTDVITWHAIAKLTSSILSKLRGK